MSDPDWLKYEDPEQMLPLVQNRMGEQKLRLFACACCRRVWHLLSEENRRIVEAAERFARGRLSRQELSAIAQTVTGADQAAELCAAEDHRASARYEAATAAWQCATLPAPDAAWFVARCAAAALADDVSPDPGSHAWRDAERGERIAQAELLRELAGPGRGELSAIAETDQEPDALN